jgi:hypothetical protein
MTYMSHVPSNLKQYEAEMQTICSCMSLVPLEIVPTQAQCTYLTLFYTAGLVVLHVMVPQPYKFPLTFFT